MHPAGGAVALAGGDIMNVRAATRATMFLGLVMAFIAATINPGDFYAQIVEHAGPAPAPGAQQCTATKAEVSILPRTALFLVLMGVVQTVAAAAAEVAIAGSLRVLGRWLAAVAYCFAASNAGILCYIVHGATVVAVGHCAGEYLAGLVIYYILLAAYCLVLLSFSFAITFF